ncbi:hypothetical protein [Pseudoalteromonas galatheae]|uniref:hypothetical protein n=1 Tax=Pseudoalteromonas galatheae TaxID=579562 RepID=UPI0030D1D596
MKNVLINNGTLGRQGKTTLAYTIYQQVPGYHYITNDLGNASVNLPQLIPKDKFSHYPNGVDFGLSHDERYIFDFGGKPDDRLIAIAQFVDLIIIPIAYQSASELKISMANINTFKKHNDNILIVFNNTDSADANLARIALKSSGLEHPMMEIPPSKYIRRLANEDKTVFDVAKSNKADRTRLEKRVIPQMNELISWVR